MLFCGRSVKEPLRESPFMLLGTLQSMGQLDPSTHIACGGDGNLEMAIMPFIREQVDDGCPLVTGAQTRCIGFDECVPPPPLFLRPLVT